MYCTSCGFYLEICSTKQCPRCGSPLHSLRSEAQYVKQVTQENATTRISVFSTAPAFVRQHARLFWLVIFFIAIIAAIWWGLSRGQTYVPKVPKQLSAPGFVGDTSPSSESSTLKAVSSVRPAPALTAAEIIASKGAEYYRNFSENSANPFDETPFSVQEKITKEEAKESDLYFIAKRNKKKRITDVLKIEKGRCLFHNRYRYKKDGGLASVRKSGCEGCGEGENISLCTSNPPDVGADFNPDPKGGGE